MSESNAKSLPLKILVVEDNMVNQKLFLLQLKNLNYKADVASDGIEALKKLESKSYDLVFLDVEMPKLDGIQTVKRIREKYQTPNKPWVVAMTAHAMEGDKEKFLGFGMNDYVSKPVSIKLLKEKLAIYSDMISDES